MIRQSVGGLAARSCAPLKWERDRTQNREPLLLIALRAERQAEGMIHEYRKIHRAGARFYPVGAIARPARRPPAVFAAAYAQSTAGRQRGSGRRSDRPR